MKRQGKRILAIGLLVTMVISNSLYVQAATSTQVDVYSPEYPDAYVEMDNISTRSSGGVASVATVYVQEVYNVVDDEMVCISSRLLTKEEVDEIGKDNFDGSMITRSDLYPGTVETKEKLTLNFSIPSQPSTNKYNLRAYAKWNGGSGKTGPASGDDFIGFAWGGGFDYSSASIGGKNVWDTDMDFYAADAVANAGKVWGFDESFPVMDYLNAYITLSKAKTTGGGNTTSFMAKYIHTYQSAVGSISISASTSGVGVGFTLSSCANQWSLVADLSGIKY